ncbi:MAG: KTSC domain-containing protein [Phycisphaerales bacterium]|nr:KTSC domain-containing protein [Phycisphaerales bacterium]
MDRISVESSSLASVGYEPDTSKLEVEFNTGEVYQYSGVPTNVYDGLMAAPSKGKYFDRYVKKAGYEYDHVS